MARIGFVPATYNSNTAEATVGARYQDEATGYEYMYVKAQAALAATDACALGTNTYTNSQIEVVPCNTASAINTGAAEYPAGVAVGTVTSGNYGFILTRGITTVKANTGVAQYARLMRHATTDGTVDTATIGTDDDRMYGLALTAESSGTLTAYIKV